MSQDMTESYNYPHFRLDSFGSWMDFDRSPAVGTRAESFPLVSIADGQSVELSALLSRSLYTVVEFGSFT